ncbi:universal stress protein [Paenibacillus sp. TRM 82003]|nr:universal stress protein [Paenibacillus sp. TRM 82003]
MIFAHVLVAYDGSKASIKALEKAIRIAETDSRIRLSVVHVYHMHALTFGEALLPMPVPLETRWQERADAIVREATEKTAHLARASVTLLQGYPPSAILQYALEEQCDLIIMGSRGLGTITEFVLGSVSHNIVQHAKLPVLVMK